MLRIYYVIITFIPAYVPKNRKQNDAYKNIMKTPRSRKC